MSAGRKQGQQRALPLSRVVRICEPRIRDQKRGSSKKVGFWAVFSAKDRAETGEVPVSWGAQKIKMDHLAFFPREIEKNENFFVTKK